MPLGAMLTSQLYIGVLTETINSEGDKFQSWGYTGVAPIACRFYEMSAKNMQQGFGQELQVDAEAIVAGYQPLGPLTTGNDAGHRRQVKITTNVPTANAQGQVVQTPVTSTWEVVKVRNLGSMGRQRTLQLKKWV